MNKHFLSIATGAILAGTLAANAQPTHYLFVAGGRETIETAPGITANDTLANDGLIDFINILVADVDAGAKTVDNWRVAGVLPSEHPDGGNIHWSYLADAINVHNGRLYVGPASFNGGVNVQVNYVVWADINFDGTVGSFTASPRYTPNQAISGTTIVEIGGTSYYYILGGGSQSTIQFAEIDSVTGAVGAWTTSTTPLPTTDWFNGTVTHAGRIITVGGNLRTLRTLDHVVPSATGDITSAWTALAYDGSDAASNRWDYGVTKTVSGGNTFLHIIGGAANGTPTAANPNDNVFSVALDNTDGTPSSPTAVNPLHVSIRRMTAAAVDDMIIVPGGSTGTGFANGISTVHIGVVDSTGQVAWSVSPNPMTSDGTTPQNRSFHGAVISDIPPAPLFAPTWSMY